MNVQELKNYLISQEETSPLNSRTCKFEQNHVYSTDGHTRGQGRGYSDITHQTLSARGWGWGLIYCNNVITCSSYGINIFSLHYKNFTSTHNDCIRRIKTFPLFFFYCCYYQYLLEKKQQKKKTTKKKLPQSVLDSFTLTIICLHHKYLYILC